MRLISVIVITCCFAGNLQAQTDNGRLTFGIAMPQSSADLTTAQLQSLENKIILVVNNSKVVTVGYYNDFFVTPSVTIEESPVVEGGMQRMTVTTVNLLLSVTQLSTGLAYNTIEKKLKGSGSNKEQSITNAISKINAEGYTDFLSAAKDKILKYYHDNCTFIIKEANRNAGRKDYDAAIGLLQSIPQSAPCYNDAQKQLTTVFAKYRMANCEWFVTQAKGQVAVKDYDAALGFLALVDVSSGCAKESKQLISDISKNVNKQEQREYDLEKARINAVRDIASAYFAERARSRRK